MTKEEILHGLENIAAGEGLYDDRKPLKRALILGEAIKLIEQEQQWILCSEKMPEEREWIGTKKFGTTISDEVYVTLETTDGKRFCDHIRFQNGKFSLSKQAELDAISKGTKPIAWMKLPELYQPKDGVGK
jgi:hypothetical protein